MTRTRVAILRGGPSDEYDISMQTGQFVLNTLDRERFEPLDVIITKAGEWLHNGAVRFPEQLLAHVDVVFNALHGTYGEDGKVQRLLDRLAVPYTGSGAYASAISMNKMLTKDALREHDIKMAPHFLVTRDSLNNVHGVAEAITQMFGPQYIIKPISSGSSTGVMTVHNPALLPQAITDALGQYDEVLVEKRLVGTEATCGVLNRFRGEDVYALPPIEIIPPQSADFYTRTAKYDGSTDKHCPGRFSETDKRELARVARFVHELLELRQYSRSDFMIAPESPTQSGGVYFLEVNTLPGLTSTSLFPTSVEAVGSSHTEFIHHLLTDALEGRYW